MPISAKSQLEKALLREEEQKQKLEKLKEKRSKIEKTISTQERKKRTKRLIEIGAIMEHHLGRHALTLDDYAHWATEIDQHYNNRL